jgi:hypothetical protein
MPHVEAVGFVSNVGRVGCCLATAEVSCFPFSDNASDPCGSPYKKLLNPHHSAIADNFFRIQLCAE